MSPKLWFICRHFFYTLVGSWILIEIGSPKREEEKGSMETGGVSEGLGTRSCGILSDMMSPHVSMIYGLGTTQGSNDSKYYFPIEIIIVNVETSCGGSRGGKGKKSHE